MTSVLPTSLQGLRSMERVQGEGGEEVPACPLAPPLVSPIASPETPQNPGACLSTAVASSSFPDAEPMTRLGLLPSADRPESIECKRR